MKRLEWLDSNFLAAVNAFLAVPGVRSNPELANLLQAVRDETLQLVSERHLNLGACCERWWCGVTGGVSTSAFGDLCNAAVWPRLRVTGG